MFRNIALSLTMVCALWACTEPYDPQESKSPDAEKMMDDKLLETAKRLPGFGGMYFDENGVLNVYMVEDVDKLSAPAFKIKQDQIQKVINEVFDGDVFAQAPRQRTEPTDQDTVAPLKQSPTIKFRKAQYDILQLLKWRAEIDKVLGSPAIVFTDLDERQNRLKIGVEAGMAREKIDALLNESKIPREAVLIEETQPLYFHADLRDKFRPMPGGVQVEADTGWFAYKICTMGFNAIRTGISGFVTNSHCTTTQGGSEGTDFHQPDDPWWTEGNKVGDEIADPGYFTGGVCPAGRRCRFSDSAFIDYRVARGRDIARTTGWNNGSLTINNSNSRLRIVATQSSWVDGSELDKIGRTTGWTYGNVNGTCQNTNVAGTNITLLCQYRVNRLPGQTRPMSNSGDSGSPVFRWMGSTVSLSGILWGGPTDGSSFVFSPMNQIEQELGGLTTFNFPTPPPSNGGGLCPASNKCCEIELVQGKPKCLICVPNNAECP